MVNTHKIIEICYKQNLHGLPALQQLVKAEEQNSIEDIERISNNIMLFLQENNLWKNSSAPPNRISSNPPTRISSYPPERNSSIPPLYNLK